MFSFIVRLILLFQSLLLFFCFIDGQILPGSLLINGGFETGDFTGWATPDGTNAMGPSQSFTPHSGHWVCRFGTVGAYSSIVQSIQVQDGYYYELSFWVNIDANIDHSFRSYAQFDGQPRVLLLEETTGPIQQWVKFSAILTAPQEPAATVALTLTFSGQNNPSYWLLDDVSLIQLGPEPPVNVPVVGAVGDPQFRGLLGQFYQIHGVDQSVYAIISQRDFQLNARFDYLTSGRCPEYSGVVNCWSHPGSYFGALSMMTASGDKILIEAGEASQGFKTITINNQTIDINNTNQSTISINNGGKGDSLLFELIDNYHVKLSYSIWTIFIDNSDMFLNLNRVEISSWSKLVRDIQPHGLLGQTWRLLKGKECGKEVSEIVGYVDDYSISDRDMFGFEFMFNKFNKTK